MRPGLLISVLLAACSGSAPPLAADSSIPSEPDGGLERSDVPSQSDAGPTTDAGQHEDAGPPPVEVGVGQFSFTPLQEGQLVELTRGLQGGGRFGGYHIFSAVIARGFPEDEPVTITVNVRSLDGTIRGTETRVFVLQPDPMSGEPAIWGLTPILDDCCLVAESEIVMEATVEGPNGERAEDRRQVVASTCPASGVSECL